MKRRKYKKRSEMSQAELRKARAKARKYSNKRNALPEIKLIRKARAAIRNAKPEIKARASELAAIRNARPEVKAASKAYHKRRNATPKGRALHSLNSANRVAAKNHRTPRWLNSSQLIQIKAMFEKAQRLGQEVDHIIPMKGLIVSGLHVPWNLQTLPVTENRRKRNSFDGTYENEGWRLKIPKSEAA
jgi:5-methylcytosine-specific restriction endonuclease McrA